MSRCRSWTTVSLILVAVTVTTQITSSQGSSIENFESSNPLRAKRGIGNKAILEFIKRRMMALSRRESSSERLAVECSRPMKRGCMKLSRRCHSSILVKRSLDQQSMASYDPWYVVHLRTRRSDQDADEGSVHRVVKRGARRRRRKKGRRIRINCQLCQEKCWN